MSIKSVSILSHKGGVGKTSIGVNIAVFLAKQGKNVCLLDNDFHGPSILTYFKPQANWINDYLFGKDELDNCIQDVSELINSSGKLYTALANPKAEVIQDVIRLDNKRSVRMLQNLIKMKTKLEQQFHVEYLIIDSSPGTGLTTVNSMLLTDVSLFIVKLSNADIMGTTEMVAGLIEHLKNQIMILINQVPEEHLNENNTIEFERLIQNAFSRKLGDSVVDFLGWIPIDPNLQNIEFKEALKSLKGLPNSRIIYTLDNPDHIFSKTIRELCRKIFNEKNESIGS